MKTCPRCQTSLATVIYEEVPVEACPQCGGEWLDAGELKQIIDARDQGWNTDDLAALKKASIKGVAVEAIKERLPCPGCGQTLQPFNYGGDTGIILDRCPDCRGVWLDAGELERVQQVVEAWEEMLDDDIKRHGIRLREAAIRTDAHIEGRADRYLLREAIINRALDVAE